MSVPVFANVELQLCGWRVSHNDGAKITFWIAEEDLAAFRNLTVRHGKRAGQRLAAALVLIADDEQPIPAPGQEEHKAGGPLCKLAAIWCQDSEFQDWLLEQHPETVPDMAMTDKTAYVAQMVREICGVRSRRDLDHDPEAGQLFHDLIRRPFMEWRGG